MINKLKILIFIIAFIFFIAPVYNAKSFYEKVKGRDWSKEDVVINLYNFDFLQPIPFYLFYKLGLSLNPTDVIVGKDGWLFFNQQSTTYYADTAGRNQIYFDKLKAFYHFWENKTANVAKEGFYFVVVPDKHVAYDDKAPSWMKEFDQKNGVVLFSNNNTSDNPFLYLGDNIKNARQHSTYPLFYKIDTHWNQLGAWIGYQTIAEAVRHQNSRVSWLKSDALQVLGVQQTTGRDLAKMFKIQDWLADEFINVNFAKNEYKFEASYWDGSDIYKKGSNPINLLHDKPTESLLIKTKNALNQSKLLWLTDSFGIAMEPYMAATFATTLHVYCARKKGKDFQKLIDDFQPDMVIITFVDRGLAGRECITPPSQ